MGFHCDGVASLSRSGQNAELLDPAAFVLWIPKTTAVTWRPEKFTPDHDDPLSSLWVFIATASRSRGLYCVVLGSALRSTFLDAVRSHYKRRLGVTGVLDLS